MTTTKKPLKTWLAIDQHNNRHWISGHSPRTELLRVTGGSRAEKMYVDGPDGSVRHIGYIIKGHWYTVFHCIPLCDALQSP